MITERLNRIIQSPTKDISSPEQPLRQAGGRKPGSKLFEESTVVDNHNGEPLSSESPDFVSDIDRNPASKLEIKEDNPGDPSSFDATTMETKSDQSLPRPDNKIISATNDGKNISDKKAQSESLRRPTEVRKVTRIAAPVSSAPESVVVDGKHEASNTPPLSPKGVISNEHPEINRSTEENGTAPAPQLQPENMIRSTQEIKPLKQKTSTESSDHIEPESPPYKQELVGPAQAEKQRGIPVTPAPDSTQLFSPVVNDSTFDEPEEKEIEEISLHRQQESLLPSKTDIDDMVKKHNNILFGKDTEHKKPPQLQPVMQSESIADESQLQNEIAPESASITIEIGKVVFTRSTEVKAKKIRRSAAQNHSIPLPHGLDD
ncbi:MAG: hypothetical protein GY927_19315 [bacterium]|nr:hypothetical protein [bacterium]